MTKINHFKFCRFLFLLVDNKVNIYVGVKIFKSNKDNLHGSTTTG